MKKKLIIDLVVMLGLILTGCGKGQVKQDSNKNYEKSTSNQSNSPYQNLSTAKAEQVKKADSAVSKVYDAQFQAKKDDEKVDVNTINKRPDNYVPKIVATAETKAAKAIDEIKGNDKNTKDIRQAYTDVVNVAKDSSLINMQTARSHIALLKNSKLATPMEKEYENPMAHNVAQHTSLDISTILNETKPLSEKKLKVAQEKAAAEEASSSSERAAESAAVASGAATSAASSSTTQYQFSGDTSSSSATSKATQATTTPSTRTTASRGTTATTTHTASSTYTAPKSSTATHTTTQSTSKASSSSYHNNTVPTTSSVTTTQNGTGYNTTPGHSMDGGW